MPKFKMQLTFTLSSWLLVERSEGIQKRRTCCCCRDFRPCWWRTVKTWVPKSPKKKAKTANAVCKLQQCWWTEIMAETFDRRIEQIYTSSPVPVQYWTKSGGRLSHLWTSNTMPLGPIAQQPGSSRWCQDQFEPFCLWPITFTWLSFQGAQEGQQNVQHGRGHRWGQDQAIQKEDQAMCTKILQQEFMIIVSTTNDYYTIMTNPPLLV